MEKKWQLHFANKNKTWESSISPMMHISWEHNWSLEFEPRYAEEF